MPTHSYQNGELVQHSKYDASLMLTLMDIFPNNKVLSRDFLLKKEDAKKGKLRNIYNTKDNSALVRKIFRVFLKEVLLEIAKGNCKFQFPGKIKAEIYVGYLRDEEVKKNRKKGKMKDFDLFSTNYKIPYIQYKFSDKSRRQSLFIYINKRLYKKLVETANEGKVFSNYPKKMEDFLPIIYKQFPDIEEDCIIDIIKYFLKKLAYNLRRGEELRLPDREGEIRFFRPLGNMHDQVMRKVRKQSVTREKNKNEFKSID